MSSVKALPRWDMTPVFPGMDSPEFSEGFSTVVQDIEKLSKLFDDHHIMKLTNEPAVEQDLIQAFETVITQYNAVLESTETLAVYIMCFVTTNSRDTLAQARLSELQQSMLLLSQLGIRLTAWIGSLNVAALIERSPIAREHAFMLRKAKISAEHLMSPEEENLASELNLSAGTAWEKLHSDVTSQLVVSLKLSEEQQELPMSMVRNLASDPGREVRRKAYEAELEGWKRVALPLAAALNSVKGEVNVLTRRRGWPSVLEASLLDNNIDRVTFDAMLAAAYESFPDFRRYLHAKAHALGLHRLAWYDIFAPVSNAEKVWEYQDASAFIIEQFGSFSQRLSDFAARAFLENWIDAEPRDGKVDGAYCTRLRGDESRVFANYKAAFDGVSTLAHELGHGYHNLNLAQRTILQRSTPMALAETASIFCETIIRNAAMQHADRQEQIAILEASLQGACQVVVDITSRFLFEQRVFEQRTKRELSIEELNNLMLEAQRETYGDGLDENVLHPYMWAMKPHYYSSSLSFYNYPYMFGLLFGLGLYARYKEDPEKFKSGYDELLSSTGLADAASLAQQFGINIHSIDFWRASLDIVRQDIKLFEELV
jgi:pepF/M3 family oligoendopeptidase